MKDKDGWWIGWIENFPDVNFYEHTRDELLESLKKAFSEALPFEDGALRTLFVKDTCYG